MKKLILTTPDLVVLALLAEHPMHGYQVNAELMRREAKDWAAISRPQIYYSLRKLAKQGLIRGNSDEEGSLGPERLIYQITNQGRIELSTSLADPSWATQRPPPPFLTWLALSPHLSSDVMRQMIDHRKHFILSQISKEQDTLREISQDTTPLTLVGQLMVSFTIHQFESELKWLEEISLRLVGNPKRVNPPFV